MDCLYNHGMNEKLLSELSAWLTQAGLAGTAETDIFSGFCDRFVAAGIPLGRAHLFIDTQCCGVSHPQELFTLDPNS